MEDKKFDYGILGYPITTFKSLELSEFDLAVLNSEYKYNTIRKRRRGGKTTLLLAKAIQWAVDNPGSQIGFIAPHMSHIQPAFDMARELLDADKLHNFVSRKGINFSVTAKKTERKLEISVGTNSPSIIRFLICNPIAKNPDPIRGWGFDLILVDEADFIDNRTYTNGIIQTFADSRFKQIYLASTLNIGAYIKYLKGESEINRFAYWATNNTPEWKNWILPASQDPTMAKDMIMSMEDMEMSCNYDKDLIRAEFECKYPGEE